MRRTAALLALIAAATATAGCSPFATSASNRSSAQAASVARADRTHEYPAPTPRQTTAAGFASPAAAIEVFATAYINWTAATLPARMRALARLSLGQARSAVVLLAGQAAADYELRHGGVANSGTVRAIAQLGGNRYLVVTEERTTATNSSAYAGLRPAWHVTLATVVHLAQGWAVSAWQPQS